MNLREQIWDMRRKFPDFKLVIHLPWLVCWEGTLRPLSGQKYKVRVRCQRPYRAENFKVWTPHTPMVEIIDPKLDLTNTHEGHDPLLHLYRDDHDDSRLHLCLDNPEDPGWIPGMSVADAIIPWASQWLMFYEFWQATGKWTGGGRDHRIVTREEACQAPSNNNQTLNDDLQGRCVNGVYQGLGPEHENFAFSALTAAVYAAFLRPPFSPRLKSNFCLPESESTSASTSSLALLQAA